MLSLTAFPPSNWQPSHISSRNWAYTYLQASLAVHLRLSLFNFFLFTCCLYRLVACHLLTPTAFHVQEALLFVVMQATSSTPSLRS